MNQKDLQKIYEELVTKARKDIDLWNKLCDKANEVFKENGVAIPSSLKLATESNWATRNFRVYANSTKKDTDNQKCLDLFSNLIHLEPIPYGS